MFSLYWGCNSVHTSPILNDSLPLVTRQIHYTFKLSYLTRTLSTTGTFYAYTYYIEPWNDVLWDFKVQNMKHSYVTDEFLGVR